MKRFQNNWENYLEIAEIPENMAVGAVSYALETAKGDRGNKVFELSNHLGNVLATVSDKKLGRVLDSTSFVAAYYEGQVRSVQDYYAFGWGIPSRSFSAGNYRFGFNGMEKDTDINDGSYTTAFRQLDVRIGRWLSVDPVVHPWQSPYSSMDNNSVLTIDPTGESGIGKINKRKKTLTIRSNLNFYGEGKRTLKDSRNFAKMVAQNIQNEWNDANGKISIDGEEYQVIFKIKGKYLGKNNKRVAKIAANNMNAQENFIRLDNSDKVSLSSDYGNTGTWRTGHIENSKSAAHEYGHLMGWYDKSQNPSGFGENFYLRNYSRNGVHDATGYISDDGTSSVPGIMSTPQMTADIPTFFGRPRFGDRYIDYKTTKIKGELRVVTQRDIELINKGWESNALHRNNNRIKMGNIDNIIRDNEHNVISPSNTYQDISKENNH